MAEEIKKFHRSRTDRVLFGVCGGLGEYFKVDPILFRLLFVLLLFMEGAGVLLYFIMVLVTPEESDGSGSSSRNLEKEINEFGDRVDKKAKEIAKTAEADEKSVRDTRNILGIIVILVGFFFLARQVMPLAWIDMGIVWSLLIVLLGFYIIFKR